jgi:hypothetical protein
MTGGNSGNSNDERVLVCMQCTLRALVNNQPPPVFNESITDHMVRMHPDPEATQRERIELERRLTEQLRTGKHTNGESA